MEIVGKKLFKKLYRIYNHIYTLTIKAVKHRVDSMERFRKTLPFLFLVIVLFAGFRVKPENGELEHAKSTLDRIFKFYNAGHDNLFNENYPSKPGDKVSYLAGNDTVTGTRVAYLWPTSGVLSGVNTLYKVTGNKKYLKIINSHLLPGLDKYFDNNRDPSCFQSYISSAGKADRYYDDNIWLAIDFCDLYKLTGRQSYLERSSGLWKFIISGWDDKLGGGIYWCEQKKQSKNTCSNAPASVLALKLFSATHDSTYFKWGLKIYNWTRENLRDSTDYLYFDNISLSGRIEKRKYTYNTGQMLQASALLYKLTEDKMYLNEAQNIARSAMMYFTEDFTSPEGKKFRIFKNTGNWFNAVLLRGYTELYNIDRNDRYISIFRDNLDHLWNHVRDENGLFSKDWKGIRKDQYKWLLDQAALVEMWAEIGGE